MQSRSAFFRSAPVIAPQQRKLSLPFSRQSNNSLPSIHIPAGIEASPLYSVENKVVLVTGAGRGIGLSSAKLLAHLGAIVVVTDVTTEAIGRAVNEIKAEVPKAEVVPGRELNYNELANVQTFVRWFGTLGTPLDVLVNNAGANFMGIDPWWTSQGVAGLPQVNFLGPYTLTRLLQNYLLDAEAPRVVNVASVMHRFAELPEPEMFLRDWETGGSYRNCKLVLVAFTELLQQKLGPFGLVATSVDPGAVFSGLWDTSKTLSRPPMRQVLQALFSPPDDAAATTVFAAAAPRVAAGGYYARGLLASPPVVGAASEPLAAALSCLDWPLRRLSGGRLAAEVVQAPVNPLVRSAEGAAAAQALWDACADLAALPRQVVVEGRVGRTAFGAA